MLQPLHGWLRKRARGSSKTPKRRYLVQKDNILELFKNERPGGVVVGVIELEKVNEIVPRGENDFDVIAVNRILKASHFIINVIIFHKYFEWLTFFVCGSRGLIIFYSAVRGGPRRRRS